MENFLLQISFGGVDVRKFEPNLNTIKPIIRDLRKLYDKNPNWFEASRCLLKTHSISESASAILFFLTVDN